MKKCSKCSMEKALECFSPHPKTKDGKQSACKECYSSQAKKYYATNRQKCRESNKQWVSKNREYERIRQAKYRIANPEIVKAAQARWMRENGARMREHGANRRAKTKVGLTKGLIERLYKLQRGLCPCCKKLLGDNFHADHIVALSRGGEHVDSNIQLLRSRCNLQKKAKDPIDFMQSRGFLI